MRKLAIALDITVAGLLAFARPALADVIAVPTMPYESGEFFGAAIIAVVVATVAGILILRRKR